MTYTLRQIDIDKDRRLGFREAGKGRAALFLHGIGSGSLSFERQLDAFSGSCRAIAWDAPGYGGSDDHPQATPSDTDYAADVLALLDALHIDEVVLCGHSLGGLIATACVALAPERIKRVVLSSCASGNGMLAEGLRQERLQDRLDAMMTLGPAEHARQRAPRMLSPTTNVATAAKVENIMARLRPTGYTQACHVLGNGNAFDNLRKWPNPGPPTLVVVGEDDVITPPDSVRRVAQAIPGALFEVFENAGHAAYLERPDTYNEVVGNFLRR